MKDHYSIVAEKLKSNKSQLKIGHLNVNGILTKNKKEEIELLLTTVKLDILSVTESKLTKKNEDSDIT